MIYLLDVGSLNITNSMVEGNALHKGPTVDLSVLKDLSKESIGVCVHNLAALNKINNETGLDLENNTPKIHLTAGDTLYRIKSSAGIHEFKNSEIPSYIKFTLESFTVQ